MVEITTHLIKMLRIHTGAGVMDCKKALNEAKGDLDLAIEIMRKSNIIKIAKKIGNEVANNGVIVTKIINGCGFILEVNCQTDFVAKNIYFQTFANKVLNAAIINHIFNIEELKMQFEEERIALITRIGEDIKIRRITNLKGGDTIGFYQHGTRIGVLVSIKGTRDEQIAKKLAMHIAASKPEFIKKEDISSEIIKKEYGIQLDIAMHSGKSKAIAEKIVEGRIKKFMCDISLTSQLFIMDPKKTVSQILREHHADVVDFVRFEVGENIDRIKVNSASENELTQS